MTCQLKLVDVITSLYHVKVWPKSDCHRTPYNLVMHRLKPAEYKTMFHSNQKKLRSLLFEGQNIIALYDNLPKYIALFVSMFVKLCNIHHERKKQPDKFSLQLWQIHIANWNENFRHYSWINAEFTHLTIICLFVKHSLLAVM